MKKQPVQKTTEELLNDLNNPSTEISEEKIQSEDTILTFLRFYNIEPGPYYIKDKYLYKLYKQFTEVPVSSISFHIRMGEYLKISKPIYPEEKDKHFKYYSINKKQLNLSEKALEVIENTEKYPPHKSLVWKDHFNNFLEKYEIKPGKEKYIWVSTNTIYDLYDKWTYEIKKKKCLSKSELIKFCKIYFEYKRDGMYSFYYKLDETIKDKMSETQARNRLTNEKKEKQKK